MKVDTLLLKQRPPRLCTFCSVASLGPHAAMGMECKSTKISLDDAFAVLVQLMEKMYELAILLEACPARPWTSSFLAISSPVGARTDGCALGVVYIKGYTLQGFLLCALREGREQCLVGKSNETGDMFIGILTLST